MPYTPQQWNDTSAGNTPLSANRMNNIEQGIVDASTDAETAVQNATSAVDAANTATTGVDDLTTQVGDLANSVGDAVTKSEFSKGQIVVGDGPNSASVLDPATDGRFLETDTTTATGVKWGRKMTTSATPPPSPSVDDVWFKPRT